MNADQVRDLLSHFTISDANEILTTLTGKVQSTIYLPAAWGLCCAYLVIQYRNSTIADPGAANEVDEVARLAMELATSIASAVLPSEDDRLIADKLENNNPMHVLFHRMFLCGDESLIFDSIDGAIIADALKTSSVRITATKATINACMMAALVAKELKIGSASIDKGLVSAFRQKLALALVLAPRIVSIDPSEATLSETIKDLSTMIEYDAESGLMRWTYKKRVEELLKPEFIDRVPRYPDVTFAYLQSVVSLRSTFLLFKSACNNMRDSPRLTSELNAVATASPGEQGITNAPPSHDALLNINLYMLHTAIVNMHYITKIFMSLPWIIHILSCDNLDRLFTDAVRNGYRGAYNGKNMVEAVQLAKTWWKKIFFVEVDQKTVQMLHQLNNALETSIDNDLRRDTMYVTEILKLDGAPAQTSYMSRINLTKYMVMSNVRSSADSDATTFQIFAFKYILECLQDFSDFKSLDHGVVSFKNMEQLAISTISASKSAVLSYVRIRANRNQYRLRHGIFVDPRSGAAVTQFYVGYSTKYKIKPDQIKFKQSLISGNADATGADTPGDKADTPGDKADTPGDKADTPGDNADDDLDVTEEVTSLSAYNQLFAFGPFTRVFYNNHTNADIARSSYEVIDALVHGQSVMVMGFGISGAGKTSTLIYLQPKVKGLQPEKGVVLHWIGQLTDMGYFPSKQYKFTAVEYYGTIDVMEQESMTYMDKPISERSVADRITDDQISWTSVNNIDDLGTTLVKYVTDPMYRNTKPTTNNDSSSRSHVVITIEVEPPSSSSTPRYIHVVDLAGVENKFDDASATALHQFKDPSLQTCRPSSKYREKLNELNKVRLPSGTLTNSTDSDVACSVIERYIFNEGDTLFITNGKTDIDEEIRKMRPDDQFKGTFDGVCGVALRDWYLPPNTPDPKDAVKVNLSMVPYSRFNNYRSYQQWGSVLLNPFVMYECKRRKKKDEAGGTRHAIKVPLTNDTGIMCYNLKYMQWRAMRACFAGRDTCLFPDALEKVMSSKLPPPDMARACGEHLVWNEIMQFAGDGFSKTDIAGNLKSKMSVPQSEAVKGLHIRSTNIPDHPHLVNALPRFYIFPKSHPGREPFSYMDYLETVASPPTTKIPQKAWRNKPGEKVKYDKSALNKAAIGLRVDDLYIVPPYAPVLHLLTQDWNDFKSQPAFNDLSMFTVEKINGIRATLLNTSNFTSAHVAANIRSSLALFASDPGEESDLTWKSVFKKDPEAAKDPLEAALELAFGDSDAFVENIRSFVLFFDRASSDDVDRLYAYIQTMYDYIQNGLELKQVATLQMLFNANDALLGMAYKTEFKLRAAIPLAMYTLRKDVQVKNYLDVPKWKASEKIVHIEPIVTLIQTKKGSLFHRCGISVTQDADSYDMGIAHMFTRGKSSKGPTCMHLPIGPTGCPVVLKPNDVSFRPSDISYSQLIAIVRFIEFCQAPYGDADTHAGIGRFANPSAWIKLFFMFGRLVTGINEIAAVKRAAFDEHVKYYMRERTKEGRFINKSVYALRDSLFSIAEKQASGNPYASPPFLSECSFFGCHPLLDQGCFGSTEASSPARPNVTRYDKLMQHVMNFHKDKDIKDLRICMITAINLSSNILDPPAVPYITTTLLSKAFRLFKFIYASDMIKNTMSQYIEPATQEPVVGVSSGNRILNPVGLDVVSDKELHDLMHDALLALKAEIENAFPMAASLYDVYGRVKELLNDLKSIDDTGTKHMYQKGHVEEILKGVTFYNNSSLIGNLTFVDSLQKRGGEVAADVYPRPPNERLFTIDVPAICGGLDAKKDKMTPLHKVNDVISELYNVDNIAERLKTARKLP